MAIFHSYVKLPEGKLHCRHLSLGFFNEGLQQSNHWIVFATSVTVTPGIECPTLTKPFHWFSQSQTRDGSKFVWWDSQEAPTFCLLSMSNCFGKILTHHQIHRHSTAFSSPQRERRPRCHLRKLTRSCNVLGMGRKIYRSKMCGSFVAVKHFMCHCKILSDAHLRMNLSRPTREMCEEFMMFQDQSLLYSALENHPISTCKWLGTQPLVKFWQLWFSRVYLPSKSMSGLGEISSIRFINRPFQANHHVTTMFIT